MNNRKYFSAQDEQDSTNWQRKYQFLYDQVNGSVILRQRDIERMASMSAEEIIAMLSALPRCRDQPLPL